MYRLVIGGRLKYSELKMFTLNATRAHLRPLNIGTYLIVGTYIILYSDIYYTRCVTII